MGDDYEGTLVDVLDPDGVTPDRAEMARAASELASLGAVDALRVTVSGAEPIDLPPGVLPVLASILREAAQGHTISILSSAREVGTGTAARLLGVSRPFVAKLVDQGILAGRKVRSHRRIRLTDLLEFKRARDQREAILDLVVAESETLGLYDDPPEFPRPDDDG